MGMKSRRKGKVGERELANAMRSVFPEACRNIQSRGAEDADVVNCGAFFFEAKRQKRANVRAALRQAVNDAPPGRVPVVYIRDDREEAFIAMRFEDWLELVREWAERRQLRDAAVGAL